MGRFDAKNEEKAPSDANKIGKGFGSGNTVRREAFSGMSKAFNALQVKVDCGEGNKGGLLSECLRVTTAYLSTKLEDSKWESLRAGMAGPGRTQSSGHKGHAKGEAWHEGKEGGKKSSST